MNFRRILLTTIATLITCFVFSQQAEQKQGKKIQVNFASYNSFSILHGYNSLNAALQTVNGISLDNTFIGAGIGIDWYGLRSVPLFAEIRQQFKIGKLNFFAYGDLGYNYAWSDKAKDTQMTTGLLSQSGGTYFDIGAGYLIPFRKRNAMVLSVGYSVKEMSELYAYSIWGWIPREDELYYETYSYKYQRLSIKLGWRF